MAAIAYLSPSPRSLEQLLADRIPPEPIRAPLRRRIVVAPTRRLLDHLELALTRRFGALAGVHFLHHQALARLLLEEAGEPGILELDPLLLHALVEEQVRGMELGLCRYLGRQPSALGPLLSTLRDLRDAGVTSDEVANARVASPHARETLLLFREFEELLAQLEPLGLGDAAAVARRAAAVARTHPPKWDELLHYGAYELIGVHQELVHSLAAAIPTQWFVPSPSADAAIPLALVARARATPRFVASTRSGAATATIESFAGPREEMRSALRRLLAWNRHDGVPFADMAVLTRAAGPFSRALAAEAALLELVPDTSFQSPLVATPAATRLATLLAALASPADDGCAPAWRRAERAWPARDVLKLARESSAAATPQARLALLAPWVDALESAPLCDWIGGLERELARSGGLVQRALPAAPAFARWLLARLDRDERPDPEGGSGLTVLDFHQARALPWRRAVIVGCNERLLPLRGAEDVFLPDADRARLSEQLGRAIPRRGSARADDELLFDVVRHAVDDEIVFTFSRADEGGRAAAASPFLRRIEPAPPAATLLRRHPFEELERLRTRMRLLHAPEALALAASARADDVPALARRLGIDPAPLAAGLDMVAAIDTWQAGSLRDKGSLRFDGGGVRVRPRERFAATELDRLGRCPLQYFFAQELGLKDAAVDEEPDGELSRRLTGSLFHDVLHRLYARILSRDAAPAADALARARELLPDLLRRAVGEFDASHELLPALAPIRVEQWRAQLEDFVARDLDRMRRLDLRMAALEEKQESDLDLGTQPASRLPLKMRFDRRLVRADGSEHLGDYKLATMAALKPRVSPTAALRGEELQLPLYALARLAAGHEVAALELLALEPERDGKPVASDPAVEWTLATLVDRKAELLDTLATLVKLRTEGSFPLARDRDFDRGQCGRCDFRRACRHAHGATGERVAAAPENAAYFALAEKGGKTGRQDDAEADPQ